MTRTATHGEDGNGAMRDGKDGKAQKGRKNPQGRHG